MSTPTTTTTSAASLVDLDFQENQENQENQEMNQNTTYDLALQAFSNHLAEGYAEEEQEAAKPIIEAAVASANQTMGLFFHQLQQVVMTQDERAAELEQIIAGLEEELASRPPAVDDGEELEVPTLAWLIANPGKGGGKLIRGNNIHTKMYHKKFKTFPAAGVWEKLGVAGQAPWKKVAAEYTAYLKAQATPAAIPAVAVNPFLSPAAAQGMSPQLMQAMAIVAQAQATGVLPGAPVAPVAAPVATGHAMVDGVKVTAKTTVYNVWREIERKKRGGVMPVAGEWKNVSAAEKAALTKKVDAVKAMIA